MKKTGDFQIGVINTCRGCGCDDFDACVDDEGNACCWVLLDINEPTGICSACAQACGYSQKVFLLVGRVEAVA
jgi:hypothetical protein